MPEYQIYQRRKTEHRNGHFSIRIDGVETEYTNDPAQHLPKSMREAIESGLTPGSPEALEMAQEISEEYSRRAMQRRVDALRSGRLFPGGIPFGAGGNLNPSALGPRRPKTSRYALEQEAVDRFLARGKLSVVTKRDKDGNVLETRPLNEGERAERKKRREEKVDNVQQWRERRAKLIADRENERTKIESELRGTPEEKHKARLEARLKQLVEWELPSLKSDMQMASHGFQYANGQILTKQVDFVNDDIRIVKCMTNTTADTVRDAVDATNDLTLDEFDGSGYSSGGQALDSQAVNIDDPNDRAEFDAADEVATLGAGTRSIQGNLLISWITNLAGSLPIFWLEYAANKTPDGSSFTDQFNAEGILQMADG